MSSFCIPPELTASPLAAISSPFGTSARASGPCRWRLSEYFVVAGGCYVQHIVAGVVSEARGTDDQRRWIEAMSIAGSDPYGRANLTAVSLIDRSRRVTVPFRTLGTNTWACAPWS